MPVLLAILKVLAVLLLAVGVLVLTALLLPMGLAIEYRTGYFRVSAVYGPLRRTVWSHRMNPRTDNIASFFQNKEKKEKAVSEEPQPPKSSAHPQPDKAPATDKPRQQGKAEPPPINTMPVPEKTVEEEEAELPSGAKGRIERALSLLEEDPKKLGNCLLGHMRWLHQHSIFKISVRHVNIFWTVTCEDAAATAVAYGAEMAAFNTALALVQQTVRLQSDCLWLEPDFTGSRRAERRISCTISASAILMVHLLYRVWKDPLLQPVANPEPQNV